MNLLSTPRGRGLLYTALYFSEGAPIGFVWWAMPTMLRVRGVSVEDITSLTAIVLLPWMFKFAWAPLVDIMRGRRWTTKSWIILAQSSMAASLLPLIWTDPVEHLEVFRIILLIHAVAAATQDVSVDRLAISTVPDGERGRINGYMQGGMLTARSLFGGVSLVVAGSLGWSVVMGLMVVFILLSLLLLLFVQEERPDPNESVSERFGNFKQHLRGVLRSRPTWMGLLFALTAATGFEAAGALIGPFLVDHGFSQQSVGNFFAVPGIIATIAGGLAGGFLTDRIGKQRTLAFGIVAFVVPVIVLGVMEMGGAPFPFSPFIPLTVLYLFIGLFTSSSYALFMDLTDPKLGATQFSAYMSGTNACESWATWWGGRLTGQVGYGSTFIAMALFSLLSIVLLPFLRRKEI